MNLAYRGQVRFPAPSGLNINMLPFVMGQIDSIPSEYLHYWPLIRACNVEHTETGKVGYLSVHESLVERNASQRRGGIHTEGHLPPLGGVAAVRAHGALALAGAKGSTSFLPSNGPAVLGMSGSRTRARVATVSTSAKSFNSSILRLCWVKRSCGG